MTLPIPSTLACPPFATRIFLKGTSCDSDVKTLRSLVQLDVAPESMIHCVRPLVPLIPKMSATKIGNRPSGLEDNCVAGTTHSMHVRMQ